MPPARPLRTANSDGPPECKRQTRNGTNAIWRRVEKCATFCLTACARRGMIHRERITARQTRGRQPPMMPVKAKMPARRPDLACFTVRIRPQAGAFDRSVHSPVHRHSPRIPGRTSRDASVPNEAKSEACRRRGARLNAPNEPNSRPGRRRLGAPTLSNEPNLRRAKMHHGGTEGTEVNVNATL